MHLWNFLLIFSPLVSLRLPELSSIDEDKSNKYLFGCTCSPSNERAVKNNAPFNSSNDTCVGYKDEKMKTTNMHSS
jgi:hypothetical protein